MSRFKLLGVLCSALVLMGVTGFLGGGGVSWADTTTADAPHNSYANNIECGHCHILKGGEGLAPWAYPEKELGPDDSFINRSCQACHNDVTAPMVSTHSSNAVGENQWPATYPAGWSEDCSSCHFQFGSGHLQHGQKTQTGGKLLTGTVTYVPGSFSMDAWTSELDFTQTGGEAPLIGSKDWARYILYTDGGAKSFVIRSTSGNRITVKGNASGVTNSSGAFVVYGKHINATIKDVSKGSSVNITNIHFMDNNGDHSFIDSTGDGGKSICRACHTETKFYTATGKKKDGSAEDPHIAAGANCTDCHKHRLGFKPAGSCNSCHGQSTTSGYPTNSSENATGFNQAPNAGPGFGHVAHVANAGGDSTATCNVCHNNHGMPTTDGKVTMGFTGMAGTTGLYNPANNGAYQGAIVPSPTGTFTCSNIDCHANVYGSGSTTTPAWNTTGNGCTACHSVPIGSTGPATGSHATHAVTDCSQCHTGATNNTTKPTANHIDGNIDVALGYPANVTKHAAGTYTGTCSTASCHANVYGSGSVVTPVWGTTGNGCSACHSVPIGSTGPATGSHAAHNMTDCSLCHTGATNSTTQPTANHRDGNIDVALGYPANVTKHASGTYTGTCSTSTCHNDGYANVVSPVWGSSPAQCSECHAVRPTTGSHTVHVVTTGVACGSCHVGAVEGSTAPTANHRNGTRQADGNCSTSTCHFDGFAAATPPSWGSSPAQCSECHAVQPTTSSHDKHFTTALVDTNNTTPQLPVCGSCHDGAVQGTTAPALGHRNGNREASTTLNGYNETANTCSTAYCHSNGIGNYQAVTWGMIRGNTCNFCHGAPPAQNHSVGDTDCHSCHTQVNATNDGFVDILTSNHLDGVVQAGGGSSCGSCHAYGPGLTGQTVQPASDKDWSTAAAMTPDAQGKGAHEVHIINIASRRGIQLPLDGVVGKNQGFGQGQNQMICGTCHTNLSTEHMNGTTRMVSFGGESLGDPATTSTEFRFGLSSLPSYNGVPGTPSTVTQKSCSNIACHFQTTPVWADPQLP